LPIIVRSALSIFHKTRWFYESFQKNPESKVLWFWIFFNSWKIKELPPHWYRLHAKGCGTCKSIPWGVVSFIAILCSLISLYIVPLFAINLFLAFLCFSFCLLWGPKICHNYYSHLFNKIEGCSIESTNLVNRPSLWEKVLGFTPLSLVDMLHATVEVWILSGSLTTCLFLVVWLPGLWSLPFVSFSLPFFGAFFSWSLARFITLRKPHQIWDFSFPWQIKTGSTTHSSSHLLVT